MALEHHHELVRNLDVVTDTVLEDAEANLEDAFFTYDDVLYTAYGVELPLELLEDDYEEDGEENGDQGEQRDRWERKVNVDSVDLFSGS